MGSVTHTKRTAEEVNKQDAFETRVEELESRVVVLEKYLKGHWREGKFVKGGSVVGFVRKGVSNWFAYGCDDFYLDSFRTEAEAKAAVEAVEKWVDERRWPK